MIEKLVDTINFINAKDTIIENLHIINQAIDSSEKYIWLLPEDIARIVYPGAISAAISLAIVYFNITSSKKKEKQNRRSELNSYREMILEWVALIGTPIDKQIESCKKIANEIQNLRGIEKVELKLNQLNLSKIYELPFEKYSNAFVINSNGNSKKDYEALYKLLDYINFFIETEKLIKEKYEEYQSEVDILMKEWNEEVKTLQIIISKNSKDLELKGKSINNQFYKKIKDIVRIYIENSIGEFVNVTPPTNYQIQNLVNQIDEIANYEYKLNNGNLNYSDELRNSTSKFRGIYKKWENDKCEYHEVFVYFANSLAEVSGKLLDVQKYFKEETQLLEWNQLKN